MSADEPEWRTRKQRIAPRLDARGWSRAKAGRAPISRVYRTEEEPTTNGPADYALWLDGHIASVVEAKKLTVGPQNVLTQAARYSQGIEGGPHNFDGHRAPFLYSTNGEVTWFHDVRHPLNRSRRVADFHTPDALRELLAHDIDAATTKLLATPNTHPRLRPYQIAANSAVEQAISDRPVRSGSGTRATSPPHSRAASGCCRSSLNAATSRVRTRSATCSRCSPSGSPRSRDRTPKR